MTASLDQAIPSPTHPFVDRDRMVTTVWYPWLRKIIDFVNGIANGELIVDGAITARTIGAGAITADAVGTNQIIATDANIANAAVTTLKIAGEAVITPTAYFATNSIVTSTYTRNQMISGSRDWTTVATVTVTVPVTSKYIVWWCGTHSYHKHIRLFTSTDTITYGVNRYDNPHDTRIKLSIDGGAATVLDSFGGFSVADYLQRTLTGDVTITSAAKSLTFTVEWCGYYDAADEYVELLTRSLIVWVAKR